MREGTDFVRLAGPGWGATRSPACGAARAGLSLRPMPAAPQCYAFLGTDEALVKEAALKRAEALAPKDNEFGLDIVSGAADNADQAIAVVGRAIEAIQTLPFLAGTRWSGCKG